MDNLWITPGIGLAWGLHISWHGADVVPDGRGGIREEGDAMTTWNYRVLLRYEDYPEDVTQIIGHITAPDAPIAAAKVGLLFPDTEDRRIIHLRVSLAE